MNKVLLKGIPASPGKAKGRVKIIKNSKRYKGLRQNKIQNKIIVLSYITPFNYELVFNAKAIITERGGITSHAAQVARELGIPCVVGVNNATKILKDDMIIVVDGNKGVIYEATN